MAFLGQVFQPQGISAIGKTCNEEESYQVLAGECISLNLLNLLYFAANQYCHTSEQEIEGGFKHHNENKTLLKCQYEEFSRGNSAGLPAKMVQPQGENVAEYDYAKEQVISTFDHFDH